MGMMRQPLPPDDAAPGPRQERVQLYAPGSAEQAANVWADVVEGGFALQHDYPDLHPAPGWHVEAKGARYEITRVEGRSLHCAKLEVPA